MAVIFPEKAVFSLFSSVLVINLDFIRFTGAQFYGNDQSQYSYPQSINQSDASNEINVEFTLSLIIAVTVGGALVFILLILVIIALIVCVRSGKPPPPRRKQRRESRPQQQALSNYYAAYNNNPHHDHHHDHHQGTQLHNGGAYVNKAYIYEGKLEPDGRTREGSTRHRPQNDQIRQEPHSAPAHGRDTPDGQQARHYRPQNPHSQELNQQHEYSPRRNNHGDHDIENVALHAEPHYDTPNPNPQPMYESLDDVVRNGQRHDRYFPEDDYRELPLPEAVDPEISHSSTWPPRPGLSKTRHNLVEIPSTSTTPSPPGSVILMRIDEEVEEDTGEYLPPPTNFM